MCVCVTVKVNNLDVAIITGGLMVCTDVAFVVSICVLVPFYLPAAEEIL